MNHVSLSTDVHIKKTELEFMEESLIESGAQNLTTRKSRLLTEAVSSRVLTSRRGGRGTSVSELVLVELKTAVGGSRSRRRHTVTPGPETILPSEVDTGNTKEVQQYR